MNIDLLKTCALAVLLSGLVSCAAVDTAPAPVSGGVGVESVELFLSRSSLGATEFEQYKLSGGLLYAECGAIARGRFLPHGQNTFDLTEEVQKQLAGEVGEFLAFMASERPTFVSPGANRSFADAGQFFLTIVTPQEKKEVRTSLDAVSRAEGRAATKLKRIAELVRKSSGADHCGIKDFFGIRG